MCSRRATAPCRRDRPARCSAGGRRSTPAARDASSSSRIPSVRRRVFASQAPGAARSRGIAVAAWTIAWQPATASRKCAAVPASSRSPSRGSAPRRARAAAFSGVRASARTWWPSCKRTGMSQRPSTPVAPTTKIRMIQDSSGPLDATASRAGAAVRLLSPAGRGHTDPAAPIPRRRGCPAYGAPAGVRRTPRRRWCPPRRSRSALGSRLRPPA